jgi:sugar diacid utilization regulator
MTPAQKSEYEIMSAYMAQTYGSKWDKDKSIRRRVKQAAKKAAYAKKHMPEEKEVFYN